MPCSKNRSEKTKRPDPTPAMERKNQVYAWKSIKSNPNMYCWMPMSKKNVSVEDISLNDIHLQDIPPPPSPPNFDEIVGKMADDAEKMREKRTKRNLKEGKDIVSHDDPKKYKIVKKFIADKGLKLYGGASINMYLPRKDKFYKSSAIPDYDFYSPNPWEDAVELAEILYKNGYIYSEVRGGIHKGTYKVYANMWPVADVTYVPEDVFNKIPTTKKQGMKIVSSGDLMIDMFRQLIEPAVDPTRWAKVAKRQKLLEKWTKPLGKNVKCSVDIFTKKGETLTKVLDEINTFVRKEKLLLIGDIAYNIYLQVAGGTDRLFIDKYEVLSEDSKKNADDMISTLVSKGVSAEDLTIITSHYPWKAVNSTVYALWYKGTPVFIVTQLTICVPYKNISSRQVASIDYIKYELYIHMIFGNSTDNQKKAQCQLKYITSLQNLYYKKKNFNEFDNSPFQRFITTCKGPVENTLKNVILQRWIDRVERSGKMRVIKPTTDTITLKDVKNTIIRIYPREKDSSGCVKKTKEECIYPCHWNEKMKKCFAVPSGVYTAGGEEEGPDPVVGEESAPYPVYG